MASRDQDGGESQEGLRSWDPTFDALRGQLSENVQRVAAGLPMREARLARTWQRIVLRAGADPMAIPFVVVALASLLGSLVLAATGWPFWGHIDSAYTPVILAAGTATTFGSIVFSVVSTSFARATDIAPGYSVVVLGRRTPWGTGVTIISVSGVLLTFATLNPTRSGAQAGVLLAVSAVTLSWLSARRTLAGSDPVVIARDASRYYRRAIQRSMRYAKLSLALRWPRSIRRDAATVELLTREHQREVAMGLLRQLRAGVRSTAGQGRITEAVMLLHGLSESFTDVAASLEGEIGLYDQLLDIPLSAADSVIDACVRHEDNEAAEYSLRILVDIASQAHGHSDYAATRSLVERRLTTYLDAAWDDDKSTVPAAAVGWMGELVRRWVAIRAYEDAARAIRTLGGVAGRAIVSTKRHIGYSATEQLAKCLPSLANEEHEHLRRYYLNGWSRAVSGAMALAPLEPISGMAGATDALVPGITLARGDQLQLAMWRVQPANRSDAAGTITDALGHALEVVGDSVDDASAYEQALKQSLQLAYAVLLLLVSVRELAGSEREALRIMSMVSELPESEGQEAAFREPDIAELVWSMILAAAYIGVPDEEIRSVAAACLERIGADAAWTPPTLDGAYMIAFIAGLRIISGDPEEGVRAWVDTVRNRAGSGMLGVSMWDWGMRIEGLGLAPSVNRNMATGPPMVFDHINEYALERWPALGSRSGE